MSDQLETRWARRLRTAAGFTLLDLMISLAITATIVALAVPNFTAWVARSKLKQALTELHSNINLSRMAAMNQNRTVAVTLAAVNGRVTASFTFPGGGTVFPQQVMDSVITTFGGATMIQFNSLGLLVGAGLANQTITLTDSYGVTFQIQVTPGGRASWCTALPCPS